MIQYLVLNNELILPLSGRIDTTNAAAWDAALSEVIDAVPDKTPVLDASALEYISSAGLRVILKLRKRCPSICLVEASSEVYEILDMTGFTEMLPVHRALRRLSVDGCELIGRGADGAVYRIDGETIVKVYLGQVTPADVRRDQQLARRAFVLGVPTAISYDVVRVGEHFGAVYELIDATTLFRVLKSDPAKLPECAELSAQLMKDIHEIEDPSDDLPDMRGTLTEWLAPVREDLPAEAFARLCELADAMPRDRHLVHCDLHLKNIMLQQGSSLLIDMDSLSIGDPVFDLACIFTAYIGFAALDPAESDAFWEISVSELAALWEETLARYLDRDDARIAAARPKIALLGYVRLLGRIRRHGLTDTPQAQEHLAFCREQVLRYLPLVNELTL